MPGTLFVISGPAGAGKGTLVNIIMSRRDGLWLSISATTRCPRKGEVEGKSYFFLSDEEFDRRIAEGDFLEWAEVHGKRYGTLRSKVEEKLASGCDVILEIDPQGAFAVRESYPDAYLIFVKPPSFETLRERLVGRGTETPEQIERRLQTARGELKLESRYNKTLINDDLERAAAELLEEIDSHAGTSRGSAPMRETDCEG